MKHWTLGILAAAAWLSSNCGSKDSGGSGNSNHSGSLTDLGRYCIVGQRVPNLEDLPFSEEYQPSVTLLDVQASDCEDGLCIQQGPYARNPSDPASQEDCPPPYEWETWSENGTPVSACLYEVRAFCSHKCTKHADCAAGSEDANGDVCSEYVCHKQAEGEAFAGHCICACKDFLIKEGSDPRRFYHADETVPEPQGCQ